MIKEQLNKIELNNLSNKRLVELFPDLTMQQRYNLMEAKLNEYMIQVSQIGTHLRQPETAMQAVINNQTSQIPTQTVRSSVKDKLQQFSTPLQLAYFMTELLDPQPNDIVLDPSAGTGNLLTFLNGRVKKIYANEIDFHRASLLQHLKYDTFMYNAEFIHNLLPIAVKPNKIIMNPPFSSGLKTSKNKTEYGFKHLTQALYRLEKPGRLVCLLGNSCMNHHKYWNLLINQNPQLRICKNYSIDGKEFYKQGTTFDTNIIVIEHTEDLTSRKDSIYNFFYTEKYSTNQPVN